MVNQTSYYPEAVDLGLSVKWASFNLGASKPEEFGEYYAWGETKPKTVYQWDTYLYSRDGKTFTKYDGNDHITLLPEDDAPPPYYSRRRMAYANRGRNYRTNQCLHLDMDIFKWRNWIPCKKYFDWRSDFPSCRWS